MGKNCIIRNPLIIINPEFISLGSDVFIRDGVRLEVVISRKGKTPNLTIGNNVNIEQNVHIVCQNKIVIGDNVSITANCAIVDATHPYQDISSNSKIGSVVLDEESFVEIGEGSFVGIGAVILPNVKIGKHVVIGANSVVSSNISDYSVVAGVPARVIRFFDASANKWVKV